MALVSPDDAVLTLADGRKVLANGKVVTDDDLASRGMIEVPTHSEAQQIVIAANKRIADLPALPREMNTLNVVLMYSLWGLVDQDIAIATGLTVSQVASIKNNDTYTKLHDDVVKRVIEADTDRIRSLIISHGERAVRKVVKHMDSEDDKVSLAAAKDLLDRAGHRPADLHEHRVVMENTLRIEYIKKDPAQVVPVIDVNPLTGEIEHDA